MDLAQSSLFREIYTRVNLPRGWLTVMELYDTKAMMSWKSIQVIGEMGKDRALGL